MPDLSALALFTNNWFRRNEPKLTLSDVEKDFVIASLGTEPQRWDASPDVSKMLELLESHPNVLAKIGSPLLSTGIGMRGCGPALKVLIEHGVEFKFDPTVYNVLHEAAWAGSVDTLKVIFESGLADATTVSVKKPHTGWPDNLSLMYWAAWGGYPELAKLLITHGAGVHHELPIKGNGERGYTSLHEAIAPGPWPEDNKLRSNDAKKEVAQILIDDGADFDVYSACGLANLDQLEELHSNDATIVTKADPFGMTPLHWAARAGATNCTEFLIAHGADVNALNRNKRAPMQLAAEADKSEIIRILAKHGADLNTRDRKGRTPLHRATYEGKVAAAETLLAVHADPAIKNKSGKTAFQIARKEAKYFKTMLEDK